MKEDIWSKLYNEARKVQNGRTISPFIEAGGVAAAILTKKGNIYVGQRRQFEPCLGLR